MQVKKPISEVVIYLLAFLASEFLRLLSVAFILDKNLLFSFLKRRLLRANAQVIIHRKNLSMAEVYIGYNLNAQTHTINSPA